MTPPLREKSRVIRISESAYLRMKQLKKRYEKRHRSLLTYSQFLDYINDIADTLDAGTEYYECNGRLYDDRAEAWGEAVKLMVKGQSEIPQIYMCIGPDDCFNLEHEGNA